MKIAVNGGHQQAFRSGTSRNLELFGTTAYACAPNPSTTSTIWDVEASPEIRQPSYRIPAQPDVV